MSLSGVRLFRNCYNNNNTYICYTLGGAVIWSRPPKAPPARSVNETGINLFLFFYVYMKKCWKGFSFTYTYLYDMTLLLAKIYEPYIMNCCTFGLQDRGHAIVMSSFNFHNALATVSSSCYINRRIRGVLVKRGGGSNTPHGHLTHIIYIPIYM